MKTPHDSSEILEINDNSPPFQHPASHEFHKIICKTIPCLITKTECGTVKLLLNYLDQRQQPSELFMLIKINVNGNGVISNRQSA